MDLACSSIHRLAKKDKTNILQYGPNKLQSWPKVLGTLDKMTTGDALFWSGKSLFNLPYPLPQKQCWNSGSTLGESTSTLCWGWGGGGGQKDHMIAKVQSVPRLLTRIVVQ